MRVLIDYRPALRERTGVGEYTHELVKALASTLDPGTLDLTIFSSSWNDRLRLDDPGLQGLAAIDRRVPVRLLNLLWHRFGWPGAEALTGRAFDVTHSPHPLLLPSRGAAQVITIHDLSFLDNPDRSRADVRRDYPARVHAHAARADRIVCSSRYTAGEVDQPAGRAGREDRALSARRAVVAAATGDAGAGIRAVHGHASSRARTSACCSMRTNVC